MAVQRLIPESLYAPVRWRGRPLLTNSLKTVHVLPMSTQTAHSPAAALLTQDEAAEYLRTPSRTLENWRLRGGGPKFVKFGRRVFYRQGALDSFIDDHEVAS